MFIHNLRIKNFGPISELETEFTRINLVTGNNGFGKSKFLSTIIYSLCDYLDEKIVDYVRTGSKSFEIETDFSHIGNSYKIQIEGSSKGSDKLLTVNNSETYKNSQAVEYIEKYIHNPKLTLASAIIMQGKGSDILFESNQKRIERLKQIFGIDKLNDVALYLKEQLDELKLEIRDLETENSVIENTDYSFKEQIELPDEKDYVLLKEKIEKIEKQKNEYEKNKIIYDHYLKELDVYKESQSKLEKLKNDISIYNNKIIELEKNINKLYTEDQLKDIHFAKNEINLSLADLNNTLYELKRYNEFLNRKNDLVEQQSKIEFKRQPRKPDIDLEALKEDLILISSDIKMLESRRELVKSGKCPTCNQDYNEYSNIDELEDIIIKTKEEKEKRENLITQYEKAIFDYNEIENYNKNKQNEKEFLQNQINDIDKNIDLMSLQNKSISIEDVEKEINVKKENYNSLEIEYDKIKSIIDNNKEIEVSIKEYKYKIDINNKSLIDLENIKEPNKVECPEIYNYDLYTELKDKVDSYEKRKKEYENIESYNKMIKEQQLTNNKKLEENIKLVDKLRNTYKLKEQTKKIIEKDFSSFLIDKGNSFIKQKMNEFFHKSYGKFNIDLISDQKSVDFYYTEDGQNYLNVAMSGGFEKEIISVAFRSALNSMGNLNFMILDEIDSFSSESNSLRLYETILQEDFEQVFAITHYPETQDFLISKEAKVIELFNGGLK